MRNAFIIMFFGGAILGMAVMGIYRWGISAGRLECAEAVADALADMVLRNEEAHAIINAADDCDIRRLLCAAARGDCDPKGICN